METQEEHMNATLEKNVTKTAREQFEELKKYAPDIFNDDFRLTNDSEYAELVQSIMDHKYLTNEFIPFEISMEQAVFSWFENVYLPIMQTIDGENLLLSFPGAVRAELFLWVTRHWHYLKNEQGREVSAEEAVYSYGAKFGLGSFNRFIYKLKLLAA
jgi:hypothetical protein